MYERGFSAAESKPVIAHVVSLIKCSKESSTTGFLDAAAVFRHSIHSNHVNSAYSYKMYAIVHSNCQQHAPILERLGYTALIRDSPVKIEDITPGWYRDHVHHENCCGSEEFIKLYAYQLLEHPISVHWDLDVALLKPMDDLYDSMLFSPSSPRGQAARARLQVQHPHRKLPERIDAFLTRDITSAQPWEKVQGVQGGFLVARPSTEHFNTYVQFIKEGNYTPGRGNDSGWGSLGYGGFQGAMAYQGVVAYFYDQYHKDHAVELNICRWNQVVADVIWRGPNKMNHHLQCRSYPQPGVSFEENTPENGHCEDCRTTPISEVNSVHYTACKKPWECVIPYPRTPRDPKQVYRLQHLTNVTTCGQLFRKWFAYRQDFENTLEQVAGTKPSKRDGQFHPDYFMGYCEKSGKYIAMEPPPDDFDVNQLYGM